MYLINKMSADSFKNCEDCQLSAIESTLVCSIFEELERQIELVKVATLKSESEGVQKLPSIKAVNDAFKRINLGEGDGDGKHHELGASASSSSSPPLLVSEMGGSSGNEGNQVEVGLEAKLEYSKLTEEFSKFNLGSKDGIGEVFHCGMQSGNFQDFSKNVDYILTVIKKTKKSLQETNNFGILKTEVDRKSEELNREANLQSDIEEAKKRISKLKQDIATLEEESLAEEQQKVGEINRLKDKHFLIESERKETLKFANMYFEAQDTIAKCNHRDDTTAQKELILEAKAKIDRDVHCLATMEAWTHEFCEKLETEIDGWKFKLKKDEMLMDMRIDSKRRDIEAQEEFMKSLNETIAQRLEELAPWEEEKAVERQERLAHMRRYYSTRKLQRWWRGYMVKLKLYRKRKLKIKGGKE